MIKEKHMKKKIIFTVVWMVCYSLAGTYAEINELITHPAYWSAFGAIFGMSLAYALVCGKK
jgi:hypothetical protein